MNRLEPRVSKLVRSTHTFVSVHRLRAVRDYAEFRLKAEEVSADIEERFRLLRSLFKKYDRGAFDLQEQIEELLQQPGVLMTHFHRLFAEACESYPTGVWVGPGDLLDIIEFSEGATDFRLVARGTLG